METKAGEIKVGLEIHGYLQTKEKLFCKSKAVKEKGTQPNINICPICTGQPGCKPMLPNIEALKKVIQVGLMLGCKINTEIPLVWQRKHYSWPDLPKGYQDTISGAHSTPVCQNGDFLGIKIRSAHLEEDPAKWDPETGTIDYNRCGMPLIEIVTDPDFASAEQASDWLKQLVITLSYIKAVNKDAGLKADVNVSLPGKTERVEIKNLNSIESIARAIEYEAKRQLQEFEMGNIEAQHTRAWDEKKGKTIKMREKEQAEDYRFIPDPDLPAIIVSKELVDKLEYDLPEPPQKKLARIVKEYKIDEKTAVILTKNLEIADFFEEIISQVPPKEAIQWVTIELLRVLNYTKKTLDEVEIKPSHFVELIKAVMNKQITELKGKEMLNKFIPTSYSIKDEIAGVSRIDNKGELKPFCEQAIKNQPKAVADYKNGNSNALNFVLGEVMKLTNKRADFKAAKKILEEMLK